QAADGIRRYKVTGVQTCALPICDACAQRVDLRGIRSSAARDKVGRRAVQLASRQLERHRPHRAIVHGLAGETQLEIHERLDHARSEERRVGKEGRTWCRPDSYKK